MCCYGVRAGACLVHMCKLCKTNATVRVRAVHHRTLPPPLSHMFGWCCDSATVALDIGVWNRAWFVCLWCKGVVLMCDVHLLCVFRACVLTLRLEAVVLQKQVEYNLEQVCGTRDVRICRCHCENRHNGELHI